MSEILTAGEIGDAFDAGFLSGFLEGLLPRQSSILASACSSLDVSYLGSMGGGYSGEII